MKLSSIDFLVRLKNMAYKPSSSTFTCPYTRTNYQIARVLYDEGFIVSYGLVYDKISSRIKIKVVLRVTDGINLISKIKFFSTPKKKVIVTYTELCKYDLKSKEYFIFTDKGLKTAHECISKRLGGVLAFRI
jgi:ribosomal protein S8